MWNFWQFCAVRRQGDPGEGKNPPTLLSTYFRLSENFFTECKCHWLRFFISNLYMDMFKIMKFHLDREPQFNEHNIKWWEASWCQVVTKVQYWCGHVVVCVCVCVCDTFETLQLLVFCWCVSYIWALVWQHIPDSDMKSPGSCQEIPRVGQWNELHQWGGLITVQLFYAVKNIFSLPLVMLIMFLITWALGLSLFGKLLLAVCFRHVCFYVSLSESWNCLRR